MFTQTYVLKMWIDVRKPFNVLLHFLKVSIIHTRRFKSMFSCRSRVKPSSPSSLQLQCSDCRCKCSHFNNSTCFFSQPAALHLSEVPVNATAHASSLLCYFIFNLSLRIYLLILSCLLYYLEQCHVFSQLTAKKPHL